LHKVHTEGEGRARERPLKDNEVWQAPSGTVYF